jgi:hypothetical protein
MPSPKRRGRGGSPLSADHALIKALIAALLQLHPKSLGGMIRFHHKVMSIPRRQRAAHFREFMPEETDEQIAAMVGVNRTTVYEWPEYVEAAERLKRVYTLPRGSRDEDGNLEAW